MNICQNVLCVYCICVTLEKFMVDTWNLSKRSSSIQQNKNQLPIQSEYLKKHFQLELFNSCILEVSWEIKSKFIQEKR